MNILVKGQKIHTENCDVEKFSVIDIIPSVLRMEDPELQA